MWAVPRLPLPAEPRAFCIFGHRHKCPANMINALLHPDRHKSDGRKMRKMHGRLGPGLLLRFVFGVWVSGAESSELRAAASCN